MPSKRPKELDDADRRFQLDHLGLTRDFGCAAPGSLIEGVGEYIRPMGVDALYARKGLDLDALNAASLVRYEKQRVDRDRFMLCCGWLLGAMAGWFAAVLFMSYFA